MEWFGFMVLMLFIFLIIGLWIFVANTKYDENLGDLFEGKHDWFDGKSVDERIRELGFELDENCTGADNYYLYENYRDRQHVELYFDGEFWLIGACNSEVEIDDKGEFFCRSKPLTYAENRIFLDKVKELDRYIDYDTKGDY